MASLTHFEKHGSPRMNHFMGQPLSPDSEDVTMLESPDSGYRSPQDYMIQTGEANHLILFTADEPCLEILEQPVEKFRFRYKSEMAGTHGSLTGVNSDRSRKQTFPTVALRNYSGKAIIRCSLYQHNTDEDNKPHAHRLVKKFGNDEVDDPHDIEIAEEDGYVACFQNMGIIHTAKKFLVSELMKKKTQLKREELKRLDGQSRKLTKKEEFEIESSANADSKSMDLNIVRLRFDAFVRSQYDTLVPICRPIYSHCINNLKSALTGELKIVRMSRISSTCKGGAEVFLLVEKVTKKNISVRFFEEDNDGNEIWESYGKFSEVDVHHQYAIVLKTPPYKDLCIEHNVKVFIQLIRKSDNSRSDPKEFTYTPSSSVKIGAKRPRIEGSSSSFSSSRSFRSAEIPTILNDLTGSLERQSLNSEINLSDTLRVSSNELESMCQIVYPSFAPTSADSEHFFDGPVNKNGRYLENTKQTAERNSQRELELKYCQNIYKELFALRKNNPHESYAVNFLNRHFKESLFAGNNPLHIIIRNYSEETQPYLDFFLSEIRLLNQTDILNMVNHDRETPLHLAVDLNLREAAEKLIISKANVNCKDNKGNTVLHVAVKRNYENIVEMIFRYSKNVAVNEENHDGDTALNIAIRRGHYICFVSLCRNKANVNKAHSKDGFTPLRMAVEKADVKMVKFLLNSTNADATIGDYKDILPITAAEVLKEQDKTLETQEIFNLLDKHMKQRGEAKPEIPIKEEVESDNEGDDNPMEVHVKKENTEELKKMYENVKFSQSVFEQLCEELDASGEWQNLADLLELTHFVDETERFQSEPTKTLLMLALNKGESLYQIRSFLDNLGEAKAVEIMDSMLYNEQ